jgi:hypothetical protein
LRNHFIDQQLVPLVQRASRPETSDSERLALRKQQQELRLSKRQPLKEI